MQRLQPNTDEGYTLGQGDGRKAGGNPSSIKGPRLKPCILPWVNFGTNTFGRARPCGYSDQKSRVKLKDSSIEQEWNSDYFKEIRRDFLDGKWPLNCRRCEYVENMGGKSKKFEENFNLFASNEHLIEMTLPDGSVPYYPPHMDIRVGTICNLKCIHCGTGASSKWQDDKYMLDKYQNTEKYDINNKWIEQESYIWDSIYENIDQTRKLSFLGGEPFANKQHNKFVDKISQTEYSKNISLFYVTNLTLLTEDIIEKFLKFKKVVLQVSIDAVGSAAEYFRFPIKWEHYVSQLDMLKKYESHDNLTVKFQWTCSNVSMFYLPQTYDFALKNYPSMQFDFCNYVEWPIHMSAQNLPVDVKEVIQCKLISYSSRFKASAWAKVGFYVNHMLEKDLWPEHGRTFIRYLDDLDASRSISWRDSFKEMGMDRYAD